MSATSSTRLSPSPNLLQVNEPRRYGSTLSLEEKCEQSFFLFYYYRMEDEAVLDRGASLLKHLCDEEEVEGELSSDIPVCGFQQSFLCEVWIRWPACVNVRTLIESNRKDEIDPFSGSQISHTSCAYAELLTCSAPSWHRKDVERGECEPVFTSPVIPRKDLQVTEQKGKEPILCTASAC